jgi:hypothetical protein
MYTYWLHNKSRMSTNVNLNLWFLNSIRQYAILSTTTLSYFISSLSGLKLVNIKTTKTYYDFLIVFRLFFIVLVFIVLILSIVSLL